MKTGIYDMQMAEYLALPALSSGTAFAALNDSPYEAWFDSAFNPARVDEPAKESDIGSCAHALFLEGSAAKICVVQPEDYRSKPTKDNPEGNIPKGWTNDAIKAARDAARSNGLIPLLPWDMPPLRAMVDEAKRYLATTKISGLFASGKPEQTIIWQDGDVLCKARPDWLSDTTLLHFKTTNVSVNPRAFGRLAVNSGYDFALMFYLRGLSIAAPDMDVDHYILAQRQTPPHSCKLFDLSPDMAGLTAGRVARAIALWAKCQAAGKWPTYDGSVHSIEPTSWQMERALEDGDIDGLGYQPDIAEGMVQA